MEMEDTKVGNVFTFALVVRGKLPEIQELINYLNVSTLKVAHKEIGQEKMWIKKEGK